MKNKEINILIKDYQKTLIEKDLSHTYKYLIELLASIKSEFSKKYKYQYKAGYISPGYLDYSYFSIYNEKLREKELKENIIKLSKDYIKNLENIIKNIEK